MSKEKGTITMHVLIGEDGYVFYSSEKISKDKYVAELAVLKNLTPKMFAQAKSFYSDRLNRVRFSDVETFHLTVDSIASDLVLTHERKQAL